MKSLVALALVPVVTATAPIVPGGGNTAPGQPMPDHELKGVSGGDGRTRLSEFRGQPVLIAWYSTVFAGVEGARAAVKFDEELNGRAHESRFVAILMEIKNNDETYRRALQMAELPGARPFLIRNQDFQVAFDDETGPPPKMILIGADGTLLYAGSYQRSNDVEKLLEAELDKLAAGWGADPLARQARALAWGRGKLGEARALIQPALAGTANEELKSLAGEIERRFDSLARSVAHHLEQGEPTRAAEALERLELAAASMEAWVVRAKEIRARFEVESARDLELESKLDSLLRPTLKSKPKKGLDEKLRALADGPAGGTKVGERARRLAEAVARLQQGL